MLRRRTSVQLDHEGIKLLQIKTQISICLTGKNMIHTTDKLLDDLAATMQTLKDNCDQQAMKEFLTSLDAIHDWAFSTYVKSMSE